MKILVPYACYHSPFLPANILWLQFACACAKDVVSHSCMPTFVATVGNCMRCKTLCVSNPTWILTGLRHPTEHICDDDELIVLPYDVFPDEMW